MSATAHDHAQEKLDQMSLDNELNKLKAENSALAAENAVLRAKLDEYSATKEAEVSVSENVPQMAHAPGIGGAPLSHKVEVK